MSTGEEDAVDRAKEWLESMKSLPEREGTHEYLALTGLRFVHAERGRFVCSLTVPKLLTDREGMWSRGAMATIIDDMSAAVIMSCDQPIKISVEFSISYFSEVAAEEEVVIESRALIHRGRLSAVLVEIRKMGSGEAVAVGRQWMSMTSRI